MKAIQTMYSGCAFRSRLEARWAVFFDALGIKWEYELEGFDLNGINYLPDFYLPDSNLWIEVKPSDNLSQKEIDKAYAFAESLIDTGADYMIVFGTPNHDSVHSCFHTKTRVLDAVYLSLCTLCDEPKPHFSTISFFNDGTVDDVTYAEIIKRTVRTPQMMSAYEAARSARFGKG
jgi:hypothetical protein